MDFPIDLSGVVLKTPRLVLRAFEETDLNDFFAYASVPGVGEKAGWPHHESIDVSRQLLETFMQEKNVWALELKETQTVVGSLGLHPSWLDAEPRWAHLRTKEIGYVLSKSCWGQGLMPEAVREVIRFCFEQLKIDALTVGHFADNHQSRRVIEKCGFDFFKSGIYHAPLLKKNFDCLNYILFSPAAKETERL